MEPTASISAILNNIAQTYEHVKGVLENKLNAHGYHVIEECYGDNSCIL